MKRKLLILDAALAALLLYAAFQFYSQWRAARAHERAVLNARVRPLPTPPFEPLPLPAPVMPSGYVAIAQKDLLDRSRNPEVVVETPAPPPPAPMPALPVYFGMMNLGDGPTAIMSEKKESPQKVVRAGESVGEFKLVSVNSDEITLEWNGQQIRRPVNELLDRGSTPQAAEGHAQAAAPVRAAQPAQQAAKTPIGPGQDTGRGFSLCDPNDSYPDGAVVKGMRKSITRNPFGESCRWDPVGR